MTSVAEVRLWGRTIAAVSVEGPGEAAAFQYTDAFQRSGIEVSPLVMPLAPRVYRFPELATPTFYGLPGLLADALPDAFGNAVLDAWLAQQGRMPQEIDAVERLCYTGTRAMGALEFRPTRGPQNRVSSPLKIDALLALASEVLGRRAQLRASFSDPAKGEALRDILRVGASAGGARAKAVIAWNPTTNEVRSGQVPTDQGFEAWLLKFDGIAENRNHDLGESLGYGAIEYAYSLMAKAAGIQMTACRLFEEGGRRHFMTRRFDRTEDGDKLHVQTLGALAHLDFNQPGAHSYEQAILAMRRLGLGMQEIEEQFRRMAFNVVARNQDDHVKNIAFLMDKAGQWSLSPAYDVNYCFNPDGPWTSEHQMTLHGKRDGFDIEDFRGVAAAASMKRGRAESILEEVTRAVGDWPIYAAQAGVSPDRVDGIGRTHRHQLLA